MHGIKTNNIYLLRTTIQFLRFLQIWPPEQSVGNSISISTSTKFAVVNLIIFIGGMFPTISLYFAFQARESELTGVTAAQLVSFYALWIVYNVGKSKQRKLEALLLELGDFIDYKEVPKFIITENKRMEMVSKIFFSFIFMNLVANSITGLLKMKYCQEHSEIGDYYVLCGTLTLVVLPYKNDKAYVVCIFHVYQFVMCIFVFEGGSAWFYSQFEIVQYIVARVRHQNMLILEAFDAESEQEKREKFNACVRYHLKIISWIRKLDDCYKNMMIIHITATATIMSLLITVITQYYRMGDIAHVLGWFALLFASCNAGQSSIDACETLALAIYNSKWYEADVNIQKDMRLMLAVAQKPLYLNAGSFGILSHMLFAWVVRTSYSYVTVLRK